MTTNNWQYATLSEVERLDKIASGDLEVYKQEKARVADLLKSYSDVGLDTSDIRAYSTRLDNTALSMKFSKEDAAALGGKGYMTLDYAPSQGGSGNMTKNSDNSTNAVKSTLQSELEGRVSSAKTDMGMDFDRQSDYVNAQYDAFNASAEGAYAGKKQDAYAYGMERLPALKETLANAGLHFDGGRARTEQFKYQSALNNTLTALEGQLQETINSNNMNRQGEINKYYTEYKRALADELARIEQLYYNKEKDAAAEAARREELDFEKYKYSTDQASKQSAAQEDARRWESEYALKSDSQSFDQQYKTAQAAFDMAQFDKEFAAKLSQQTLDNAYRDKEYALKADTQAANEAYRAEQMTFDKAKFEAEYALKLSQADLSQANWEKEYAMKQENQRVSYEQWKQEQALKQMSTSASISKASRDYALALLKNEQAQAQWQSEFAEKQRVNDASIAGAAAKAQADAIAAQAKADAAVSPTASGAGTGTSAASAPKTQAVSSSKSAADMYEVSAAKLGEYEDTVQWMSNETKLTPYGVTYRYSRKELEDWIGALAISAAQRETLLGKMAAIR